MHRFLLNRAPDRSAPAASSQPPLVRRVGLQCALVAAALVAAGAGGATLVVSSPHELISADGGLTIIAIWAATPCDLNHDGSEHVTR